MTNQKRDRKGRYSKTKWTALIIIVSCFVFTGGKTYIEPYLDRSISATNSLPTVFIKAEASVTAEAMIAKTKTELVESLAKECETKDVKEPDAAIIFDTNGEPSIGAFQYQRATIQHFYKTLYSKEITRAMAIAIAIDHDKAASLTSDILFKVEGGWKNWLNCGQRLDLPVQIALLKKLDK